MMSFRSALVFAALLLPICSVPVAAQDEPVIPPNPFAGFESFRLGNGLKVWYGHLPGATVTSMAIIVPAGFDADAAGREHTAHLLEHVLLSDRDGVTEAELVRGLASRGGTYNGLTYADRTAYLVDIGTVEAAYGLQWLHGVVAPRQLTQLLVERNRAPVAIEIGARPRGLQDWLVAWYIDPPALRSPDYWAREFGLRTAAGRDVDAYAALHATSAADLNAFFERHYTPAAMTLVVIGGAPRGALQGTLDETFGTLPWRPARVSHDSLVVRRGESRRFGWWLASTTTIRQSYRIAALDGRNQLRALLTAALLQRRLMERLRRGEAKAIYSVGVDVVTRGAAAAFTITARMEPSRERDVRAAIDEEIERLRDAVADSTMFYTDRDAYARELRTAAASPAALRAMAVDRFHRPDLHAEFPDYGGYATTAGADSIAAFAERLFRADNRVLRLWRPLPAPALLVLLAAAVVMLATRSYRLLVHRPADMTRIRFVARLRHRARWLTTAGTIVGLLVAIRLLVAGAHVAAEHWLFTLDAPLVHAFAAVTLLFTASLAVIAAVGRFPHKVLVFEHEVRLKSPTYRSVILPRDHIRRASVIHADASIHRDAATMRPRGVLLEAHDGSSWRLHVRDPLGLHGALRRLLAVSPAADGDAPITAVVAEPTGSSTRSAGATTPSSDRWRAAPDEREGGGSGSLTG